jgi:hypothetical protein
MKENIMLVEINYTDHNGSVCPFCGAQIVVNGKSENLDPSQSINQIYDVSIHFCTCKNGHGFFACIDRNNLEDEYKIFIRLFCYHEDYTEYTNQSVALGPNQIPYSNEEDISGWLNTKS